MTKSQDVLDAFLTIEMINPINLTDRLKKSSTVIDKNKVKKMELVRKDTQTLLWVRDENLLNELQSEMRYKVFIGIIQIGKIVKRLRIHFQVDDEMIEENRNDTYLASFEVNQDGIFIKDSFRIPSFAFYIRQQVTTENALHNFTSGYKEFVQEWTNIANLHFQNRVDLTAINEFENSLIKDLNMVNFHRKDSILYMERFKKTAIDFESFYIKDLTTIRKEIKTGLPKPLTEYLNGSSEVKMNMDCSCKEQLEILNLENLPNGRWPSPNQNRPYFMQQLAINLTCMKSSKQKIRSVNGPPGTGKTTLLKDIFAHIIVERAVEISKSSRGFTKKQQINVRNGTAGYYPIRSNLKGFSMVVASSNNNAVENISRDLPKMNEAIHEDKEKCEYTLEVNEKVRELNYFREFAGCIVEKSTSFNEGKEDLAWGMFSAPLGKKSNMDNFFQIIEPFLSQPYQKKDSSLSFSEATDEFNASLEAVQKRKKELIEVISNYEILHDRKSELEKNMFKYKSVIEKGIKRAHDIKRLKEEETSFQELLDVYPSHLWIFTFFSKIKKEDQNKRNEIGRSLADIKLQILTKDKENREYNEIISEHERLIIRINLLEQSFKELIKKHDCESIKLVDNRYDDNDYKQLNTPYLENELQHLRALCFVAALKLHKAFIQENRLAICTNLQLLRKKGLINLNTDRAILADLWDTLHLLVPVVSTTFSSLGSMLNGVYPKELGYLFIDEAGQAVPQAAVGGIWRARQTIAVGDPIQVEPVVTLDHTIFKDIQSYFNLDPHVLCNTSSVQNFADRAHPYGAFKDNDKEWIGLPLWVHRRCLNPMFSIANQIAYDNNMVLADKSKCYEAIDSLPESAWINVRGKVSGKQTVPAQLEVVKELVRVYCEKNKGSESIYIITPFSEVMASLRKELSTIPYFSDTKNQNASIGTVHTFQGKEAHTVIFVTGLDDTCNGAINWLIQKPNLLNVAVTRAKERFLLVGDYELLHERDHFKKFGESLKVIEGASLLTSHIVS